MVYFNAPLFLKNENLIIRVYHPLISARDGSMMLYAVFPHQDKDVTGCKCGIMYAEHTSIIPLAKDRYDKPKDTPQKVSSTQIKALLMNWWLIEEHRPKKQGLMKLWNPALLNSAANTQVLLVHIGNRCFFHLKKVLWNHTKALKQPYEFICAMVTRWTAHTLVIHIYPAASNATRILASPCVRYINPQIEHSWSIRAKIIASSVFSTNVHFLVLRCFGWSWVFQSFTFPWL